MFIGCQEILPCIIMLINVFLPDCLFSSFHCFFQSCFIYHQCINSIIQGFCRIISLRLSCFRIIHYFFCRFQLLLHFRPGFLCVVFFFQIFCCIDRGLKFRLIRSFDKCVYCVSKRLCRIRNFCIRSQRVVQNCLCFLKFLFHYTPGICQIVLFIQRFCFADHGLKG